ncbi:YqhG family protein [Sporosarcina trichiuri]|uniref:YqhG family protein n=1 Tax=Sporosarcina trichiuri TaxID=3056445 RepID=UPI0025B2B76A|nr:YqhG family protein [Sporosarcina sp. 0.2-SM1T-5]WJY27248.1 YqhG family protein [Sporosarcina sp. 0.2-SM1T-5]
MDEQAIKQYIHRFFEENRCGIIEESDDHLTVQLTTEMDKRIMNRPYYWSYVESVGAEPNPAQLKMITNPKQFSSSMKGERIHFGSPRLHQLFEVAGQQGKYVQLYETPAAGQAAQVTLTPWLGVNYKVTYSSDRTKEALYSLGMNLMNGAVIDGFQPSVRELELAAAIPANTYYLPYIIHPNNAVERLDTLLEQVIRQDDHSWMDEAKQRHTRDMRVLDYFYADADELPDSYKVERQAIDEQYATAVTVEVISGGLFYLHSGLLKRS